MCCNVTIQEMGSGQSTQPNFKRRPQLEVKDHMERLQRISDLKAKPIVKDGGVLELSVNTVVIKRQHGYISKQDYRVQYCHY